MFAYIMSERISIVVPDGTLQKIKSIATKNEDTQSACLRKIISNGIKLANKEDKK